MRNRDWQMVELVFGMVIAGCGGTPADGTGNPPPGGPAITDGAAYFPLAVGAAWTYRISSPTEATADKTTTVEAMEPEDGMNGPMAFRIRNQSLDGTNINWEQLSGTAIVRYRQHVVDASDNILIDKAFVPSSVDFDESETRLAAAASWNETYLETQTAAPAAGKTKQEFVMWTVEAIDDVVSVPAGTFTCIRVRRHHSSSKNPADEVAWYAKGIGKVKETGVGSLADQTRELLSATLP